MSPHRFAGNRKQVKSDAGEYLGEPTNEPLVAAAGTHDQLAESIGEPHGISDEEAERQLDGFPHHNRNWDLSSR